MLIFAPGVGPADVLVTHSIPVVFDSPGVGQNLQDQIFIGVSHPISVVETSKYLDTPSKQALALDQYNANASGPYSSSGGYLSFEKLPSQYRASFTNRTAKLLKDSPADWPEIEYIANGFSSGSEEFPTLGFIAPILLTPMSRGNITLRSTSISDSPLINLNWLADAADGEVLIAAFKRVRDMWRNPVIADIVVGPEFVPGETVLTDAQILDFIKQTSQTIWHASSTCAMGKSVKKGAVVDSKARVFGVRGLRVVDYSVVPFSLPGHPQASVYMLAEKIAHDIRAGVIGAHGV
jgi:choline dehydrogenase